MARSRPVFHLLVALACATASPAQEPSTPGKTDPTPCPAPSEATKPGQPEPGKLPPPPRPPGGEHPKGWPPPPPPFGRPGGPGEQAGPGGPRGEGKGREWRWDKKREILTPEQMKEKALKELEKLTPEQRNEVWKAVWAVLNLTPEKRLEVIGMEDDRRQKMREEIDRTLQTIGVKIPDDQRRKFFHRYFGGRREIEEQLKKEGEERRQTLMKEFDEKLKQEFGSTQAVAQPIEVKEPK